LSRIIYTSVGTSLIEKLNIDSERNYRDYKYDDTSETFKQLYDAALNKLKKQAIKKECSAEINSLETFGISKDDSLILLLSDSLYGLLCGRILEEYLRNKVKKIELFKLENLNEKNQSGLTRKVLRDLCELFDDCKFPEKYLNITGGFKSLIPYFSTLGMIFQIPIFYIFEDAEKITYIPPLPIEFNSNIISGYEKIIFNAVNNNQISIGEYNQLPENLKILFERKDNETITPSILTDILAIKFIEKIKVISFSEMYNRNNYDETHYKDMENIIKLIILKVNEHKDRFHV